MSECRTCRQWEAFGFGQMCPCVHKNGKCVTKVMEMEMYSVYDRKMHQYHGPMLAQNLAVFMRTIRENAAGSLMERHAGDFEIHRLGTFNVATGEIDTEGLRPQVVAQLDTIFPGAVIAPEVRENAAR